MNETDLEGLYARLEKPVYNVVFRWVWDGEEAHDLVQETFLRLWKMRRRIVAETVEPLVYRIALNLARSRRRRLRIRRFVTFDALAETLRDPMDVESDLAGSEERTRVRNAVLALPEDLRQVVMLCSFTDLRYDQIARVLSIPEGTVGSRRHRALTLLRESLSEENGRVERAG